ncbi:hypothetical protein EG329_011106 [Mollisiaceae sp. DMI_Dod_QoI]|nr:hypothetical protein EG329_011106 [Helotiales sp. DMI_Dod_QoI]
MGSVASLKGSQGHGGGGDKRSSEDDLHDRPSMEGFYTIDKTRWAELMYSLQSIAKLQRAATRARIEARQKRREASFKRDDVWIWDAKFMGEIQRLNAQGNLRGFEELSRIAAECQAARDLLGPLEQDNIEAESRWQGEIWKLKEAEADLYTEFEDEFRDAEEYAAAHSGEAMSSHTSLSDSGSQSSHVEALEEQTVQRDADSPSVLELHVTEPPESTPVDAHPQDTESASLGPNLDSGVEGLDLVFNMSPSGGPNDDSAIGGKLPAIYGPPQALSRLLRPRIERYSELPEDFSTRRGRINEWLENIVLESRLESRILFSVLRDILAVENQIVPSNWSQLVIAYWELDGASVPRSVEGKGDIQRQDIVVDDPKAAEFESIERKEKETSMANEPRLQSSPNVSPRDNIIQAKSDGDKATNTFNNTKLSKLASSTPALGELSPPHSHSSSRPASRDLRPKDEPP